MGKWSPSTVTAPLAPLPNPSHTPSSTPHLAVVLQRGQRVVLMEGGGAAWIGAHRARRRQGVEKCRPPHGGAPPLSPLPLAPNAACRTQLLVPSLTSA